MLVKLIELYPELCPKWLITGVGDMVCDLHKDHWKTQSDGDQFAEIQRLKEQLAGKEALLKAKEEIIELLREKKQ